MHLFPPETAGTTKKPKVAVCIVRALCWYEGVLDHTQDIVMYLKVYLNSIVPLLRQETIMLCSRLYERIGDDIYKYISGIKSVILKEIETTSK